MPDTTWVKSHKEGFPHSDFQFSVKMIDLIPAVPEQGLKTENGKRKTKPVVVKYKCRLPPSRSLPCLASSFQPLSSSSSPLLLWPQEAEEEVEVEEAQVGAVEEVGTAVALRAPQPVGLES